MKKFFVAILILSFLILFGYWYVFKNERNFATEDAIKISNVVNIISEYEKNQTKASAKYLNKIIEFSGNITNIDSKNKTVMLEEKVFASFKTFNSSEVKINSKIKLKGRFLGYDELLEEIKLDNCTIIK